MYVKNEDELLAVYFLKQKTWMAGDAGFDFPSYLVVSKEKRKNGDGPDWEIDK